LRIEPSFARSHAASAGRKSFCTRKRFARRESRENISSGIPRRGLLRVLGLPEQAIATLSRPLAPVDSRAPAIHGRAIDADIRNPRGNRLDSRAEREREAHERDLQVSKAARAALARSPPGRKVL
jgi:hypothetical protein